MKKVFQSLWTSALTLASAAAPVFAAEDTTIKLKEGALPGLGNLTIPALISGFIRLAVIAAAVIFFFWLIFGGIKWITAGGDKAKTEEARNQITAALVGLVIVFSAWAIAQLIKTLFGFDIFNLEIIPFKEFK